MYKYSLRFQLSPSLDFNERMNGLLDFCEKAEIDDVMFFIGAEELCSGHITIEEAQKFVDVIKRASQVLRSMGITISLNPWATLGHYDGGRFLNDDQEFRTMEDYGGKKAKVVVCPLDETWRKYYVNLLQFYVDNINPDVLWFEDDMRLSNHDPVSLGCFCEKHLALINQKLGTNYDRETLLEKITQDEKVKNAYLETSNYTIKDTLNFVTKNLRFNNTYGLMTGGLCLNEGRKQSEVFSLLKNGKDLPYNRVCLFSYRQKGLQEYAWYINSGSMCMGAFTENYARLLSEIENYPHTLYTKSANFFAYQLLTSVQLGFVGTTLSIFEFNGNGAIEYERYAKVLKKIKPYLSRVADLSFSNKNAVGVKVLISENTAYNTTKKFRSVSEFSVNDSWIYAYLTQLGISCCYTFDAKQKNQVVAVGGHVLENFDNQTIIRLFENNVVILTGDSVKILYDRKLEYLIGGGKFTESPMRDGSFSIEQISGDEKVCGIKNLRATAQFFCGNYLNVEYGKTVTEFTQMLNYNEQKVGSGIVRSNNAVVIPFTEKNSDAGIDFPVSMICYLREYAIKKAIMSFENLQDLYFVKEENVCLYAHKIDGKTYLACVNFVDDEYEKLHIYSRENFNKIKVISDIYPDGKQAKFNKKGNEYVIEELLPAQNSYLLEME